MKKVLFTLYGTERLHNLWKEFIYDPPKGYCYYNLKGEKITKKQEANVTILEDKIRIGFFNNIKSKFLGFALKKSYLDIAYRNIYPKFSLTEKMIGKISPDIVYSVNGKGIKSKIPWIVDAENVGVFTLGKYNYHLLHDKRYRKIIEKNLSSEYCKKILPYSVTSMKSILANLNCENFIDKIQVVPNVIKIKKNVKKIPHDTFNILFTGSYQNKDEFYNRGGQEVLISFLQLTKKLPKIKLICRCAIPENMKKMIRNNRNIEIYEGRIPKKEFEELFLKSDIYLSPAYVGYAISILDAMNYELPIITTNFLENGEKVQNYYNGFKIPLGKNLPQFYLPYVPIHFTERRKPILDKEFIDNLCDKIQYLYMRESDRVEMGKNSKKMLKNKFSIDRKNQSLKKIYDKI